MLRFLKIRGKYNFGLIISVVVLGISSIITQIILLREFLNVFYGNELVMGVILANWMLLTGLGAYIGRLWRYRGVIVFHVLILQILIASLPIITVFLLNYLKNIVFTSGSMVNVIQIFYSSLIILVPYCVTSGLLFTFFSVIVSRDDKRFPISKVYSLEAIGSIIGGLGFNFVLLFILTTFQSLKVILVLNLLAAFILAFYTGYVRVRFIIAGIILLSGAYVFSVDLDHKAKSYLFPEQEIQSNVETPYGNIIITRTGEQYNIYDNGVSVFCSDDIISREEDVHYAMVQHASPKNVLLISGGLSGTINEILKYNVDRIDYVEINPWLIDVSRDFVNIPDTSVLNISYKDARVFIKNTGNKYDVIISNLPEPSTIQLNRYYTQEFFQNIKNVMSEKAVFSVGLPSTPNYISEEEKEMNSVILSTLQSVFESVLLIPGGKNYFLSSTDTLNIKICELIEGRNIETEYVNKYYLDDELIAKRSLKMLNQLNNSNKINRDFIPLSCFNHLQVWLSFFHIDIKRIAVVMLLILVVFLLLLNPVNLGMFTAGFTASSMVFLLIIAFQVLYGYIYQFTGIIITIFMAGLAVGTLIGQEAVAKSNIRKYLFNQSGIAIYALILPFLMVAFARYNFHSVITESIIILLAMIIGFLVGFQFNLASRLQHGEVRKVASALYGADLFGSALGALIVAVFLLPLFGIVKVSIIISFLNLLVILIIFVRRKISPG